MEAPDDLWVAAAAAACTVVLTLLLEFALAVDAGFLPRMVPLVPYFAYLFTRRAGFPSGLDTVRNWAALTVAASAATFAYYAV